MSAKNATQQSAKRKSSQIFTAEEKAAMKERAKELKAATTAAEAESDLLAKIAEMPAADSAMGKKLHEIVKASAPVLSPKLWYGMPAYANKDGKVVCWFQSSDKFNTRYPTFSFSEDAYIDEGDMWPVSFAITKLTGTIEAKIEKLVKKAVTEPSSAK